MQKWTPADSDTSKHGIAPLRDAAYQGRDVACGPTHCAVMRSAGTHCVDRGMPSRRSPTTSLPHVQMRRSGVHLARHVDLIGGAEEGGVG
jgi:hypothetical protein